jgi:hypothetical protein
LRKTEAEYIELGRKYELGKVTGDVLRVAIEAEHISERAEARELIAQGRAEAHTIKPL